MNNVIYDTFISYRREGGSAFAGTLYDYLLSKNFKPFYDRIGIENGRFDEQIRINLINCENYILILSKNALDRTINADDWVRHEIELAINNNLNIIVLVEEGFFFPDNLPDSLSDLPKFQHYSFRYDTINSTLKEIEPKLLKRDSSFNVFDPNANGKIKISGEYITLYEDEDNGRIITRKAPAMLKVIGNNIYGKTSFSPSATWAIRGKIHKKKRLTGLYYAKSILDDGFGTFYLEVKSPSILEGYWCGYDNENNKTFCGKYVFKKSFKDYNFRFIKTTDFSRIIHIADKQLGKDYVTTELLNQSLTKQECFCLVVEDNKTKKPIGFSFCLNINYEDAKALCKCTDKDLKELVFCDKIGYIKTVVIDKKYEGYGIGSNLVKECIEIMKKDGCTSFISTAWKHCGIINIANVLTKNGFIKTFEIPNYWYEDSIAEGYSCPQCGNPCHCSCVIYIKI